VGIDTTLLQYPDDCDTTLITTTLYADILQTHLVIDTCSLVSIPPDTARFTSNNGCDSLVITTFDTHSPDTLYNTALHCGPQTIDTAYYQNQAGCDSLVITDFLSAETDTTVLDSLVCTPQSTDTLFFTNQAGCDSLVIINYTSSGHVLSLPSVIEAERGDTVTIPLDMNFMPDSLQWNTTENFLSSPASDSIYLHVQETTLYQLTVIDENGCVYSDAVQIVVQEPSTAVYIPNAFSPNGDGINDSFRPFFGETTPQQYQLTIYDRWGSRIFNCVGTTCSWNGIHRGQRVNPGVYSYKLRIEYENRTVQRQGDVTVLQ
jgi:gliding motility-associated-like protein